MFKVFDTSCRNCLLSKDRIVSPEVVKELLNECKEEGTYFICHKSSMEEGNVCCSKFFKEFKDLSKVVRMAEHMGVVEFVPHTDFEKYPTWEEMNKNESNRQG